MYSGKKYIYEIKSICHFDEINNTLKKHEEIMEAFNKADYNYFIKLKKFLPKNTLIEFFSNKKSDIKKRLDAPNIFKNYPKHLNNDQSNNLFYYNNCQIIDKDLFDALEELDIHLREKTFEANAIYSSDKIILFLFFKEKEKYIINVGEINNNTNEFEIVYLIQSEESTCSSFDLKKIFVLIKNIGYNHFKNKIIINDHIYTKIDHITVKAKIYRISQERVEDNSLNINLQKKINISEQLKALILLSISQNIDFDNFRENSKKNIERVYLMNYNYLLKYRYEEILSLLTENKQIMKLVEEINNLSYLFGPNNFEEIISQLNQDQLLKIDKEVQNMNLSTKNWEARPDLLILKGKNINIYKEFILVKEKIFNEIKSKLSLSTSQKTFYYTYNDGDILIIPDQDIIYFGI